MPHITTFSTKSAGSLRRTITTIPSGEIVTKAWLTVKADPGDADPGLVQLTITASPTAAGVIEEAGVGGTTDAVIRFDLQPADTDAIGAHVTRYYDISVLTDGSPKAVVENHLWTQAEGVTATLV